MTLIQKPNPYVTVETKVKEDNTTELTFKYPKSKIFVGGLDFNLTLQELKQHFSQFGEVQDAIILKNINTG
jgi:RNA recognition motif-containing protein